MRNRDKIFEKLKNNKKLISNFSYLSIFQVFSITAPLITYPYLMNVLGRELLGHVLFAQTIMSYLTLLVDFGFRNLGVKYIAICDDDKRCLGKVLSSILQIRLYLFLFGLLVLLIAIATLSIPKDYKLLYLFSTGAALTGILYPEFYFLGVEKMRYVTIINVLSRIVSIALLFLIVRSPHDFLFVPLLNTIGIIVGGVFSWYIIISKHRISLKIQPLNGLLCYIKDSFTLFLSDAIISIKDRFTVLFIGLCLGMGEIPIYDLGIKIVTVLNKPSEMMNTVILPIISKGKNLDLLLKYIKIIFFLTVIFSFVIFLLLPIIVSFFIRSSVELLPLQLMLLIPTVLCVSYTLATNYLIVFGLNKLLLLGMFLTTIFYLILVGVGAWFSILNDLLSFVIVSLFVFVFELLFRLAIFNKTRNKI
jgi:PST family polysaccharide transporter